MKFCKGKTMYGLSSVAVQSTTVIIMMFFRNYFSVNQLITIFIIYKY